MMNFADFPLHFRVYDTGTNGNSSHVWFFYGKGKSEVVQHCFARAVAAPALVGGSCGTRGGENDAATRSAEEG